MEAEPSSTSRPSLPSREPSHTSAAKPKGILKSGSERSEAPVGLTWDEANLMVNEENKDSKMKITEPKTPYVRYDAETDTVMDIDKIPGFELGAAEPVSPSTTSSRHNSFTSTRSGSSSRRSSDSGEKKVDIVLDENVVNGGLPTEDEEDESLWDEETRAKHRMFKSKRNNHYGNEAEALKKAKALMDEEAIDDEESDEPPVPRTNGTGHST